MKHYLQTVILLIFVFTCASNTVLAEEVFTWEDCINETKKNHPDLISAQEEVNQSIASKAIVRSGLLPQITTKFTRSRTEVGNARTHGYTYGITGSQLLFNGFKSAYDVFSADEAVRSALYNQAVTSSEVRLRLHTAFVYLLKAQALLDIAKEIVQRRKQNLKLLQLRYEVGKEHEGSVLTVQAGLAQAEFEVAKAMRNIVVVQRQLNKELGRTQAQPLRAKGDFSIMYADREKPDFEHLAKSIPSLQYLVAKRKAARFDVKSAYANFFPTISAESSLSKTGSHWPLKGDPTWSVQGIVSFPLFEGGSRIAKLKKAKSAFSQALAVERSSSDKVILAMEEAWAQLQDAVDTVLVQKQFLEASQKRAEIAQVNYSNGLILFDNWIIIEDELVQAKKTFLSTQADALIAEAQWIKAKGGTLEYDEECAK